MKWSRTAEYHKPVLNNEVIRYLITDKSGIYLDGTLGGGGHTRSILKLLDKNGKIFGLDIDEEAVRHCEEFIKDTGEKRLLVKRLNYADFEKILNEYGFTSFTGIVLDLGISSRQIDNPERGFSYLSNSFLDMRMDQRLTTTAFDVINKYNLSELKRIFKEFGEIRFYSGLASELVRSRKKEPVKTTIDLLNKIKIFSSKEKLYSTASRVFQSIRIEINEELTNLKKFLNSFVDYLAVNGRICIISYHSLEDRIVKDSFRTLSKGCICPPEFPVCTCGIKQKLNILTKKPVYPAVEEVSINPRSRSARLRVAERRIHD